MTQSRPFGHFRTTPETNRLAVMLHLRYALSLRNMEHLLHECGVEGSHETVRVWWQRFGPVFAAVVRWKRVSRMRSSRWRWHLDQAWLLSAKS